MALAGVLAALLLLLLQGAAPALGQDTPQASAPVNSSKTDMNYFVEVKGGEFVVNCKKFYVSGWNQWETVEAAAGALQLYGASLPDNTTGPQLVRNLMAAAGRSGLSVVRSWAHAVSPQYALETAPGQYNEAIWRGLDYFLEQARANGIRVLLAIADNWQPTGGADQWVKWAGGTVHEQFFSNPAMKQMYKNHVSVLLNRINTINGRKYSEDPTIFGFNLINEPRCYQCGSALRSWANEMSAYVRSLDPNHLITIGEEGFYPRNSPQAGANPQGARSWAFEEGQDFLTDHDLPNIDFVSTHLWVDNWQDKSPEFVRRWVRAHVADAAALRKPLLLEEFGKWGDGAARAEREQYYQLIYDEIAAAQSAKAGGAAKGALFWQFYDKGQKAPAEEGGSASGLYGVFEADGTFSIIRAFTDVMRQLSGGRAPGCAAGRAGPPAKGDCPASRISGRPGTGYEGPACDVDINECARGTAGCAPEATCVNALGGYACRCPPGYAGDGFTCSATPELAALAARYTTQGGGRLACQEGQDVAYPAGAPGYSDDPTGGLGKAPGATRKDAQGSRTPVSALQCMMACELAQGCDAFSYNPEQKKCFLKKAPSSQVCKGQPTLCVSARGQSYSCGVWQTYVRTGGASVGGAPATRQVGSTPAVQQGAPAQQAAGASFGGQLIQAFGQAGR